MNNNLYLELLDGEYAKLASSHHPAGWEGVHRSTERYLKIMALFGYQATLSDTQTTDSGLWLDLWANPSFGDFLSNQEHFVNVRAGKADSTPYERTIAGLIRTQNPSWISSGFIETDRIKRFAESVLRRGEDIREVRPGAPNGIPDELLSLITESQHAVDRKRMKSLLRSLLFFMHRPSLVARPQGDFQDYYSALGEFAAGTGYFAANYEDVGSKQEFVRTILDRINESTKNQANRDKRSVLLAGLDTKNWPRPDRETWYTAVHAWNCAVRNSLGVEGIVLGSLSEGVHVGLYMEPIEKLYYPPVGEDDEYYRVLRRSQLSIVDLRRDPQQFDWAELNRMTDATTLTRKALVESRDADSSVQADELQIHVRALSECIAGERPIPGLPGNVLTIAGILAVCWGMQLPQEIANLRTLVGGALLAPNLIHSLKGRWIATGLKKAHADLSKSRPHLASPKK